MKRFILTGIFFFFFSISSLYAQSSSPDKAKGEIAILLGGKKSGSITREELLSDSVLRLTGSGTEKEKLEVAYLKLSVAGKSIEYKEYNISGNILSEKVRALFKTLPIGSKLYLEFIEVKRANTDDGFTRKIGAGVEFVLVEE